jgi:CHASE3 domain sensor protein
MENLPGAKLLKNLKIGSKLTIGFGILVALVLLVTTFSWLGSTLATENINQTSDVRVPTALTSARAQADLLKMLGDVRGYLALGQPEFRESYEQARQAFEADLNALKRLEPQLNETNQARLAELDATFQEWSKLPETLFELRDDQLEREPAYKILATEGILRGGQVLIDLDKMIEAQGNREPTEENAALLTDMARFQGTFAAMLSGLRGYVTTRNRTFKGEYESNRDLNEFAWTTLRGKQASLTSDQQALLAEITKNREAFLALPDQMFEVLESEQWRQDLYLFSAEGIPLTEKMQTLLDEMTNDQQMLLETDLDRGRDGLIRANLQTLVGGVVAVVIGLSLAIIFRENIAAPVVRLTGVAERIRGGDLDTQAKIESRDEIGVLAGTFNNMTSKLRQTLFQVTREKKRADDLLNVVIPIGVELSSERNFNRLLENMLVQAKQFCHANAGALYLREGNNLKYVIIRNDAQTLALGGTSGKPITLTPLALFGPDGQPNDRNPVVEVALSGNTINISDSSQVTEEYDVSSPKELEINPQTHRFATSILNIPLKNGTNEVRGVLQLLDAQDLETRQIIPFDPNIQQMMESFSSLAAAALDAYIRESSLRQEIQQLRIEIDEAKRKQQVSEIVDTDFFQDLQAKAHSIRSRRGKRKASEEESDPE